MKSGDHVVPGSGLRYGEQVISYTVVLEPSSEGGYTVTVPALPGCVTEGETTEECVANAHQAIALYLEELKAAGEAPPQESEPPQLHTVTV